MIHAGAQSANLTNIADVETAMTPMMTAIYGLNGGNRNMITPLIYKLTDC